MCSNEIGIEMDLTQSSSQITSLHRQVLEAQQTQAGVDQSLSAIEAQQKELDRYLTIYEQEVQNRTNDTNKPLVGKTQPDKDRERS